MRFLFWEIILKVTVLSDKDSSAQAPGVQGGLFASAAHFAKVSSSASKGAAPGMGLFFHVWACLIRSQGSPAQAGKCLLVSANTDDRNVCLGHCSALNGAGKALQSVLSTDIPSLGMPEEGLAQWEEGTTFQRRTKVQKCSACRRLELLDQQSSLGRNQTQQHIPPLREAQAELSGGAGSHPSSK